MVGTILIVKTDLMIRMLLMARAILKDKGNYIINTEGKKKYVRAGGKYV